MPHAENKPSDLKRRTIKSTLETLALTGGTQVLRFGSNLILTRLLFPEAFGLMALVQVILMGLEMLSDFGLRASIIQSDRGDDPVYLNTAWVMQIIRGFFLWGLLCLATPVFVSLYNQPELASILPVAGLSIIIIGFQTTKALTVQRHMNLGRFSWLRLLSQVVALIVMISLAYVLESVWALVIGNLVQAVVLVALFSLFLDGPRNRPAFEKAAAFEILSFGKFLFISSFATFAVAQGDRAILGLLIPIEMLGVYGIGFALAALPLMVMAAIAGSVIFPLYRMRHPRDLPENQANIFKVRRLVTGGGIGIISLMAFVAPWLIDVLYDDRYALAGPITMLLCVANVPLVLFNGTMDSALAKGDAYRYMLMNVASAVTQTAFLWVLASTFGIFGAAVAMGVAPLVTYPLLAMFLRRYGNWDLKGDVVLLTLGFAATMGACWYHWDKAAPLL